MSEAGNGQGCEPWYVTSPTSIAVSSATSRRTAASSDSPGSTNPAGAENCRRPADVRPSSNRSSSSTIAMITAGSVRG